jgi:hypothetical protein
MSNIALLPLLSMTWVEPDPPRNGVAYATDGEFIYERQPGPIYRRAHWTAVAMVIDWNHLPGFLWEPVEVAEGDPQRMTIANWDAPSPTTQRS